MLDKQTPQSVASTHKVPTVLFKQLVFYFEVSPLLPPRVGFPSWDGVSLSRRCVRVLSQINVKAR